MSKREVGENESLELFLNITFMWLFLYFTLTFIQFADTFIQLQAILFIGLQISWETDP